MPSLRPALWFVVIYGLMVPKGLWAADSATEAPPPKTTSVALPPRAAVWRLPPMDTLLPKTTVGFVSATNSVRLTEQWNKTQLGKLMTDPVMKPFEEDFRAQMQAQWSSLADRLGIHLDDLRGVSTGEASLALLEPQPGTAATSLLLDVSGNLNEAQGLLAKARANLTGRGRKRRSTRFAESPSMFTTSRCPRASRLPRDGAAPRPRPRQARRSISSPRISSAPATISRWSRVFLTGWPLPASLAAFPRSAAIKWS